MATSDLKAELSCSICLNSSTEPVLLKCGHNMCQDCIVNELDTQEGSGVYSCRECGEDYPLEKKRKLCTTVENIRASLQEDTVVWCTYCDPPLPASKSCLHCEASFCEKHLSNHSKSAGHILSEPTTSFNDRKCSTHNEILKYYCTEHGACICTSCWVAGDHKGHQVELLNEASEKLKDVTGKMSCELQETAKRIENLENHRTHDNGKAAYVIGRVTELFRNIRSQLDGVEKRILSEISRQEKQIQLRVLDLIQQLEGQKDELSTKINQMEELGNIQDPLTVLKNAPNRNDMSPEIGDTLSDVKKVGRLVEGIVFQMLQRGLCNFNLSLKDLMTKEHFSVMEKSTIFLDINTAHDNLIISKKRNRATHVDNSMNRPDGPKRFKSYQVLNRYSFTSGTHYWEVDVRKAEEWLIGVASESMERKTAGNESFIGFNDKSWSLSQMSSILEVRHNNTVIKIDSKSLLKTVGIHLDYDAGHLTFYQLCDPARHLHTFTTTFTEPLYAAFYVFPNSSIRIIK